MIRILIVEDDLKYQTVLRRILEEEYEVDVASSVVEALSLCETDKYDLIISDLHLKDIDGLNFLSIIKKMSPKTKTILLTGNPSAESEIITLDQEINLYLSKDKSMDVILKYIQILLKKVIDEKNRTIYSKSENITIDIKEKIVTKNGVEVQLLWYEFLLLEYFLNNKNKVLSREEIVKSVWSKEMEVMEERIVDVYVRYLRQKLSISSITSVRGVGYEWSE